MSRINLPFKVGHTVEVRSFELGFRGAWFLCEITRIFKQGRSLFYNLKYLDYPGEGLHKTKVFQNLEGGGKRYLMVRPVYPRKCHENEILMEEGLEEDLLVHDSWKVGDLVEWWKDHCYWSGTVLEVRENDSLQIELLPPPYGEGEIYDVLSEDLRPSLDWSLEEGWTVPLSEDGEKRRCARLIKPSNQDEMERDSPKTTTGEQMQRSTSEVKGDVSETSEEQMKRSTSNVKGDVSETSEEEKMQRPTQKVKGDVPEATKEKMQRRMEKLQSDGDLRLNIMESETKEAAVKDLEEMIVKIQWIKSMLAQDESNPSANSSWKYVDYRPSSSGI